MSDVKVSKCEFYNECDKKVPYYSDIACLNDFSNICIFKQLKRLQTENERLKKEIWQLQHRQMWNKEATLQAELLIKENERLQAENEELKKDLESYKCQEKFPNQCRCAFRCLGNEFCQDADKKINSYKQALEEIRERIKKYHNTVDNGVEVDTIYDIETKISEVLDERD